MEDSMERCSFEAVMSDMPAIEILKVIVDYGMTFEEMIKAGKFDRMDEEIIEDYFPINKRESGELKLHIVHFGRTMTTKQVLDELDKQGLRPAQLPELLALAAAQPDLQRKYYLAALDFGLQNPNGNVIYPILNEYKGKRDLRLFWEDAKYGWDSVFRFVVVSK